jgi:hypothetical protein
MECTKCKINDIETPICDEKPETLLGQPIGMYHCPDCGEMVLVGYEHPYLCKKCKDQLYRNMCA